MDNVSVRRHELLNENLFARHRLSLYKLLVREVPEVPKIDRLLPLLLTRWQDPILEDTIHLNAGHREINYDWPRKLN